MSKHEKWTQEQKNTISNWHENGLTYKQIAQKLVADGIRKSATGPTVNAAMFSMKNPGYHKSKTLEIQTVPLKIEFCGGKYAFDITVEDGINLILKLSK